MKRLLPSLLILLGVAEIIVAVMDAHIPIMIAMVLGIIFVIPFTFILISFCVLDKLW